MANAAWPVQLPQAPTVASPQGGDADNATLRTAMAVGPAKVRARTTAYKATWSVEVKMDVTTQLPIFRTFHRSTLVNRSQPFDWTDPITRAATTYRFVGVPQEKDVGPNLVSVTFTMEEP